MFAKSTVHLGTERRKASVVLMIVILLLAARFGGAEIQPIVTVIAGGLTSAVIEASRRPGTAGFNQRPTAR